MDGDGPPREPDDAFDKKLLRIFGIAEDYHVAAVRLLQTVGQFVDNEVLPVVKGRAHAGSGDDKRLRDKKPDGEDNRGVNKYEFEELGEKILTTLRLLGSLG